MDAVSAVIVQRSRDAERLTPLVGWSALVHIAITLLIAIVPASWLGSVTREPENVMQISLGGAIGPRDGLLEHVLQVALRALAVLREDQHTPLVPLRRRAPGGVSKGRQSRTQVLANPVNEVSELRIGKVSGFLCDPLHPVQKRLLPAPHGFSRRVARRLGFRFGGGSLDFGCLFGVRLLGCQDGTFVVGKDKFQLAPSITMPDGSVIA